MKLGKARVTNFRSVEDFKNKHRSLTPARLAFVVGLTCFGLTSSSIAQDSMGDQVGSLIKKNEEEIGQYLAKHPVRPSPLFESASDLITALGKIDAMILDTCKYDPDFPDWREAAKGLHENTVLTLGEKYRDAKLTYREETPASETVRRWSLCEDEKRHHRTISRELPNIFATLRRQGY
jgi:hypothetical protein